ncbi:hypothetical protein RA28_10840 [Ruegeria sp. ANG-S4]|nr:hypothetical protein RA28_10840 [Ruegeria sp. ANG-S4]
MFKVWRKKVGNGLGWETNLKEMRQKNPLKNRVEAWIVVGTFCIIIVGSSAALIYSLVYL